MNKNHDENSKNKNVKETIRDYVISKLVNKDWKLWETMPSENALAIKFNCSRLTARNSINDLVQLGIITPFRGHGYIVTSDINEFIYIENEQKYIDFDSEEENINPEDLNEVITRIKNEFWIKPNKILVKRMMFSKDNKPKIIVYSIKNIDRETKSNDSKPKFSYIKMEWNRFEIFKKDAFILGLSNDFLLEINVNYDVDEWININLTIKDKDQEITQGTSRYITSK